MLIVLSRLRRDRRPRGQVARLARSRAHLAVAPWQLGPGPATSAEAVGRRPPARPLRGHAPTRSWWASTATANPGSRGGASVPRSTRSSAGWSRRHERRAARSWSRAWRSGPSSPSAVLRDHRSPTSYAVAVVEAARVACLAGAGRRRHLGHPRAGRDRIAGARIARSSSWATPRERPWSTGSWRGGAAGRRAGARRRGPDLRSVPRAPDRSPSLSSAPRQHRGGQAGLFARLLGATDDLPASQGSFAVWSVCSRYDLICDPSTDATVRTSLAVARVLRRLRDAPRGRGASRGAAGAVARSVATSPGPHRDGRPDGPRPARRRPGNPRQRRVDRGGRAARGSHAVDVRPALRHARPSRARTP